MEVKHHIAVDNLAPMDREAGLECLCVEESMGRLRLPEGRQNLGIDPMRVAWLGADAVANTLPVVFCWRGDSVSVIAQAHFIGCLELPQRVFHGGKLRVPPQHPDGARPQRSPLYGEHSSRIAADRSP
jgi:hypothetical protein